jgi:GDP-L-fucose synthase
MFEAYKPEVVIHLAAYSGGIGANNAFPADFFYKNSLFVTLMFEAAARHGVKKMIYPVGGCSYPASASSPISEDQMWFAEFLS